MVYRLLLLLTIDYFILVLTSVVVPQSTPILALLLETLYKIDKNLPLKYC